MLNCDGYSTVKYLMENFPAVKDYFVPMAKINENAKIYPCYMELKKDNNQDNYVIRFMGKNQSPIFAIENDKQSEWFTAVTYRVLVSELDIKKLYEFEGTEC